MSTRLRDRYVRRAQAELAPEEAVGWTPPWMLRGSRSRRERRRAYRQHRRRAGPGALRRPRRAAASRARACRRLRRGVLERARPTARSHWSIVAFPTRGLGASRSSASRTSSGSGTRSARPCGSTSPTPSRPGRSTSTCSRSAPTLLNERALRRAALPRPRHRPDRRAAPQSRLAGRRRRDDRGRLHVAEHADRGGLHDPDRRRTEGTVALDAAARAGRRDDRPRPRADVRGRPRRSRSKASTGEDVVRGQVATDEGAACLGEVALVDGESRVGRSGLTSGTRSSTRTRPRTSPTARRSLPASTADERWRPSELAGAAASTSRACTRTS